MYIYFKLNIKYTNNLCLGVKKMEQKAESVFFFKTVGGNANVVGNVVLCKK